MTGSTTILSLTITRASRSGIVQMSSNQGFWFSPPTPTEPLRLHKHSHKVSIEESSPRESHNAYIQDAADLGPSTHPLRTSSTRNHYTQESQPYHESRPTRHSPTSQASSISSGWGSSCNTETNNSSTLPSISAQTNSSSYKAQFIPDSPEGVMGNFIPMDPESMTNTQANAPRGSLNDT